MEIIKEVSIKTDISELWGYLINRKILEEAWGQRVKADFKKNGYIQFPDSGQTWKITEMERDEVLSFSNKIAASTLLTSCRLIARGKRTILKVTISGWENIEQEISRKEIPKISMEWEKRLNNFKKTVEKAIKSSSGSVR